MTAQPRAPFIETSMVSMAGRTLGDLRSDDSPALIETMQVVLVQVQKPRANLGGSGPPGRAD